jgi:uncharacterized protein (TIGR02453 family)
MAAKSAMPIGGGVKFAGFSRDALQFLRDLKQNNDRDWFRERKPIYEETLKQPAEQLVSEAAAATRKLGFPLFPKERSPLTRIYRDIRFSSDKTPFHTHIGASLKGSPGKSNLGELYIHIHPEDAFVAAGFWMPERPFLQVWRERMAQNPKEFNKVLRMLAAKDLKWLDGYSLKRLPRGFENQKDSELEPHFKRQVFIVQRRLTTKEIGSPKLVDLIAQFAIASRPLLDYGWNLKYVPKRDILADSDF